MAGIGNWLTFEKFVWAVGIVFLAGMAWNSLDTLGKELETAKKDIKTLDGEAEATRTSVVKLEGSVTALSTKIDQQQIYFDSKFEELKDRSERREQQLTEIQNLLMRQAQ